MTATQTADTRRRSIRPFQHRAIARIYRANYIAIYSNDPVAAARYAVENMGFYLVHADREGRRYLAGHGLDAYSLVYTHRARSITFPTCCAARAICSQPKKD